LAGNFGNMSAALVTKKKRFITLSSALGVAATQCGQSMQGGRGEKSPSRLEFHELEPCQARVPIFIRLQMSTNMSYNYFSRWLVVNKVSY